MFKKGTIIVGTNLSSREYALTNQEALMEVLNFDQSDRCLSVKILNFISKNWKDMGRFIGVTFDDLKPELFRAATPEDLIKFNKGVKYEYKIHKDDTI